MEEQNLVAARPEIELETGYLFAQHVSIVRALHLITRNLGMMKMAGVA
jgi:hypothetical protein